MRRALSLFVKLAVSGLLLYLALRSVNIGTVASRLTDIDPKWIALALLVPLAQNFLLAIRWRTILSRCGSDLPLGQMFRYGMVALFFNQTLPSSVGGDAMRIWLVAKQTNWRAASYAVVIDRVVGLVALAMLVTVCLPWTLQLMHSPVARGALLLIGLGCIAGGLVFVSLASDRLLLLQRWGPTRHLAASAAVAAGILRSPRTLISVFGLSFAIQLLTAVNAWCVARSVNADLTLLHALFLVLPVMLIAVVPVSIAGWGIREGAMVAAFRYAGLAAGDGLIVSLLYGAILLAVGALGGLVWVLTTKRQFDRKVVPVVDAGS